MLNILTAYLFNELNFKRLVPEEYAVVREQFDVGPNRLTQVKLHWHLSPSV